MGNNLPHLHLVQVPRGVPVADFWVEVNRASGQPARELASTHFQPADAPLVTYLELGVNQVLTSPEIGSGAAARPTTPAPSAGRFSQATLGSW
jgi:hypothetical protein